MPASSVVRGVDPRTSGGSATSGVFVTHSLPAGAQAGDLLIVGIQLREPTTTLTGWRVPTGWTARTNLTADGNGSYAIYTAKYGTDVTGTSWTWDNGASNTTTTRWSSCLVALNGSLVTGVAGHAAGAQSTSSPSLTTAGPTVLVGYSGSRTTGGVTYTPPTGWAEQSDVSESTATNAATLEVSVNDTVPVAAGSYSYAPTATPTAASTFTSITAFTYAGATPVAATAAGSVTLGGSTAVRTGPTARGGITLGGAATATPQDVSWVASKAWNAVDTWPGPDTPGTVVGAAASSSGGISLGGSTLAGKPAAAAGAAGSLNLAGVAASSTIPAAPAGAFGSISLGFAATVVPVVPQSKTKALGVPLDIYRSGGFALWYTADAYLGGSAVVGATGLRPSGGSITDTMRPGVRRTLNLQLPPTPGLYDLLKPTGTQLRVYANVRTGTQATTRIPMGVFTIDSQSISVVDGSITITAPDLWQQIVRSKFIGPQSSITGLSVVQQIAQLIRGALGASTQVTLSASSTAAMSAMTWEKDRAQAIIDLATSINAWVYVDRAGNWVVADVPTLAPQVKWLIDANPYGVLVSLDRQRSRTNTYNVVCVEPQSSSTPSFPTTWVWDSDSHSDTYAGPPPVPGPVATYPPDPAKAGPFGLSVYYYDTSLPLDPGEAGALAFSILAKTTALASQVSLTMGHNPNVDAGDICGVLPPPERYDIPRYTETHMAETVTHPLTLDNTGLKIDGRSSRTDPYS